MAVRQLVSVIVPCFNQGQFVRESIESVLKQSHPDVELIVINDGSTDESHDIIAGFGDALRLIDQPNRGRSVARNVGIEAARGEFIKFLDADDMLDQNCIATQLDALPPDEPWNEAASFLFYGNETNQFTVNENCHPEIPFWRRLLVYGGMPTCAPLMRSAACQTARFPVGIDYWEDTRFFHDVWTHVGHPEQVPFVSRAKCLIRRHAHNTLLTSTQVDWLAECVWLLESWNDSRWGQEQFGHAPFCRVCLELLGRRMITLLLEGDQSRMGYDKMQVWHRARRMLQLLCRSTGLNRHRLLARIRLLVFYMKLRSRLFGEQQTDLVRDLWTSHWIEQEHAADLS